MSGPRGAPSLPTAFCGDALSVSPATAANKLDYFLFDDYEARQEMVRF
jgi:hypothetical protein